MKNEIVSPILYAAPFVGGLQFNGHSYREELTGHIWLTCAEHSHVCCVSGIHPSLGPIQEGDFVRVYLRKDEAPGYVRYSIDDIPKIGGLADEMLLKLFGCTEYGPEMDAAVIKHCGLDDECDDDRELIEGIDDFLPGDVYYKVVRV